SLTQAGHVTQVRLIVSSATVTDGTGTHVVDIPSGIKTGIKLNLDCDIDPNVVIAVLLDFNVGKSFVLQGNGQYKLQPVIPAVVKVLAGTATGTVSDAGGLVAGASVTAVYSAGTNYTIGTEVNSTVTQTDGTFKLWALLPGTYTLNFSYLNPNTN